jgi:hypothetical protein
MVIVWEKSVRLDLEKLRPVPPWFRNIKKLPSTDGKGGAVGGRVLLIGLGVDGATTLSVIASQLDLLGKTSTWWQDDVLMVAVGVDRVELLPVTKLHQAITTINLEPNLAYFRRTSLQRDIYAQWWHKMGKPTSGRGLARLALFSSFKDGFESSPLYHSLVYNPRNKNISTSYVMTSLTDTVGTALMWDVLHFLSRNNLQSNAALSVLWLSISGGKPSNTQGNAWNELQRLGNGGNTQAIYNAGDVTSNQGYIKAGASRTILVGLPTKKLERLERAQNSLKALANAVLWTLDPSFHRAFKEDWRSAPDKRAKDTLALNLSSMGAVNFYQAIEHIEKISAWRILDELLWEGAKGSVGIFDKVQTNEKSLNPLVARFLRGFKVHRGFFGNLADAISNRTVGKNVSLAQEDITELVHAYKEGLIYQLDTLLNGEENELKSQNLRSFYAGHLFSTHKFVQHLEKGFTNILSKMPKKEQDVFHTLSLMQNFTGEVCKSLEIWLEAVNADSSTGLRRLIQSFLREAREELYIAYENNDNFRILLNHNFSPENLEEQTYMQWYEFLLNQEGPNRNDPISVALSRVGWHFTFDYSKNAVDIKFCVADIETKNIKQIAFATNEINKIAKSLYRVFRRYTEKIYKEEKIEVALSHQFDAREFAKVAKEESIPYMGDEKNISSMHILGKNKPALNFAQECLEGVGQKSTQYTSSKSSDGKIGVLSIRHNVDLENLFSRSPKVRPREYVFSAERAYDDFSKRVFMHSEKPDRNFAYLLSDSTLAEYFGKGLLAGYIRPDARRVLFKFEDQEILIGQKGERVLFYRDHVLLAAMEDFVIELPAKANYHHPLHPRNRSGTLQSLDDHLQNLRDKQEYQDATKKRLDELKENYTSHDEFADLTETFFLWLSILYDNFLSF